MPQLEANTDRTQISPGSPGAMYDASLKVHLVRELAHKNAVMLTFGRNRRAGEKKVIRLIAGVEDQSQHVHLRQTL